MHRFLPPTYANSTLRRTPPPGTSSSSGAIATHDSKCDVVLGSATESLRDSFDPRSSLPCVEPWQVAHGRSRSHSSMQPFNPSIAISLAAQSILRGTQPWPAGEGNVASTQLDGYNAKLARNASSEGQASVKHGFMSGESKTATPSIPSATLDLPLRRRSNPPIFLAGLCVDQPLPHHPP